MDNFIKTFIHFLEKEFLHRPSLVPTQIALLLNKLNPEMMV